MLVRLLVSLLLSMNLAVAGWWWLREPVPAPDASPAADAPALVLLSEAEAQALPASAAEPDSPPVRLSETPRCFSIGPFPSPADLRRTMAELQPIVEQMQFRETRGAQLRGYRVFLPAFANRAQALETARQLAEQGVRDYYVVTAGDEQNTISLGMFRDLGNAEKRRAELRALGVEPRLEPRSEDVAQWWLDLRVDHAADWRQRLRLGAEQSVEAIACD